MNKKVGIARTREAAIQRSIDNYLQSYFVASRLHGCEAGMTLARCLRCFHEVLDAGAKLHAQALEARCDAVSPSRGERELTTRSSSRLHRPAAGAVTPAIARALRKQAVALQHLPVRDVFITRVLVERLHFVASDIKTANAFGPLRTLSRIQAAAAELKYPELRLVIDVEVMPVGALVHFLAGDLKEAEALLLNALAAAEVLTTQHRHRYLAAKQIQLGLNLARVQLNLGNRSAAEHLVDCIARVIAGQPEAWPFAGSSPPRLPPTGQENRQITLLVARERQRVGRGVQFQPCLDPYTQDATTGTGSCVKNKDSTNAALS